MAQRQRPRRIELLGTRVQIARNMGVVVNVSRTGVLVRASFPLRPGGEWPLVLELPDAPPVKVLARVIRCTAASVSLPGGAALRGHAFALAFLNPSSEADAVLVAVCGAGTEG